HGPGLQARHAERVKQAQQQPAVELPLVRAVRVPEHAERPFRCEDRAPARHDLVERLLPADRCEASLALGADALERREHALGGMHPLVLAIDLGAGEAGGHGMLGVARSEEHTSELQSLTNLVCRLLLEKKKKT